MYLRALENTGQSTVEQAATSGIRASIDGDETMDDAVIIDDAEIIEEQRTIDDDETVEDARERQTPPDTP